MLTKLSTLKLQTPHNLSTFYTRMSLASQRRKVFRPLIDDIERLSKGDAAKKRGTGSRSVPHRLNADERKLFEFAKKNNYLILKGTGYRKERKGSPLANIWRQWCDANAMPCVMVVSLPELKFVMVDLSTLRRRDCRTTVRPQIVDFVKNLEGVEVDYDYLREYMPFTIYDADVSSWYTDEDLFIGKHQTITQNPEYLQIKLITQQGEIDEQAQKVRVLKEEKGFSNQHPEVQQEVAQLLELKKVLKNLQQQIDTLTKIQEQQERPNQEGNDDIDDGQHPVYTHAIWQIPAYLVGFQGEKLSERQLAEAIVKWAK